jgi:hypothetical protein
MTTQANTRAISKNQLKKNYKTLLNDNINNLYNILMNYDPIEVEEMSKYLKNIIFDILIEDSLINMKQLNISKLYRKFENGLNTLDCKLSEDEKYIFHRIDSIILDKNLDNFTLYFYKNKYNYSHYKTYIELLHS